MNLNIFLDKDITVKQIRSFAKLTKAQLATLKGIGFKKIGQLVEFKNTNKSIIGMLNKVQHLVSIQENR